MESLQKEFNNICESANLIGASAIVIKDDEIKESLTYGYLDKDSKDKMTLDTIFRIASVSKLEVAISLMQLVSKGLLNLDEDISTYLGFKARNPKYPDTIITTRMLMTHTSSINDGNDLELGAKEESGYLRIIGLDEQILLEDILIPGRKYFVSETFNDYEPGTDFMYSNFGTGIMACILEKITGEYFFDYVKKNVFSPLNINASFQAIDLKDYPIISTYDNNLNVIRTKNSFLNKSIEKRPLGNNYVGPAGGLFISTNDLAKLMNCYIHEGEKILDKETFDKMLEVNWIGNRHLEYYAKGLQFMIMDLFDNRRLFGHFGSAYGVKSFLFFNPIQKLGMVFLSNGGNFKYEENEITNVQNKLLQTFLDKYWDDSIHSHFTFKPFEEYGILDGRKVKINYLKPTRNVVSKRPFLDIKTLITAFNINTSIGFDTLSKEMYGKHVFEYLSFLDNEYNYECSVKEEYPNNDPLDKKNIIYTYYFDIVRKDKNKKRESLKYNFHTHCNYCDHAEGVVSDYIDTAYNEGYEVIGMSDHGPIPYSFLGRNDKTNDGYLDGQMTYDIMLNNYLKDIEKMQEKYDGKMKVLKAVEIEYIEGHDDYYKELLNHLDYLLYGPHYTYKDGVYIDAYYSVTSDNVIDYAKEVVKGLDSKLFKIIAHPDLFLFRYQAKDKPIRTFDENAKIASLMIIEACERNNIIMELNVGGIGKGYNIIDDNTYEFAYPRSEFWKLVKKHPSIRVVIGCDAHSPKALHSNNVRKLIDISRKWGFEAFNIK